MKHIHAELMMEYAKDAMETDKPWLRWEKKIMGIDDEFVGCGGNPSWNDYSKYRRKPMTININGYEVPEPYRGEMKEYQPYFTPELFDCGDDYWENYRDLQWLDTLYDHVAMKNGLVHLTEAAAIKHAEALLSFTSI
jgi:hypothetical protein